MSRPDAIVGYTYKAENLCPSCTLSALGVLHGAVRISEVEGALDLLAEQRVLDRYNESSYDSDDFPKVIFAGQFIPAGETCGNCNEELQP